MTKIFKVLMALLLVWYIFAVPTFSQSPASDNSRLEVLRDIPYANERCCYGDLYRLPGRDKYPVVIVIHGGGWEKGDKSDLYLSDVVAYLPTRGYAVFSINYRLTMKGGCFPNSVKDVVNAAYWLTINAKKYNLDSSRIAMLGESAGGNLALMAAYNINNRSFRTISSEQKLSVNAAVAFSPVVDLSVLNKGFIDDYMDDTVDHAPKLFGEASPLSYLDSAVPTLCVHGCADTIIPADQSRKLVRMLRQKHKDAELLLLPTAGHIYYGPEKRIAIDTAYQFLERHL